jgi:hypothetical protein
MKKKMPPRAFLNKETFIILMVVCCGIVATLSFVIFDSPDSSSDSQAVRNQIPQKHTSNISSGAIISSETVPLSIGDEPINQLFIQSGCAVCHTIPGVDAAKGREGPKLILAINGPKRLADPNYEGTATTVREYITESILNPGAYVVPGYPDRVMPRWYGKKLNAKALDRIASYLEGLP